MGENPSYFRGNSKKPVECVSWQDAQEFCQKLTQKTGKKYRLPSEAEWEYSCRADSQTRYYFGDDASQLKGYAWFGDNSGKLILDTTEIWSKDQDNYFNKIRDNDCKTHPVGQKKPNKWGLYDMSGNLWEWCEDVWHRNYENAPKDGSAWNKDFQINEKIIRGGSWNFIPWSCRYAFRFYSSPDDRVSFIGFRVVCAVRGVV
jgi:formylglycine-generating enzyme required for sulfatase activity